MLVAPTEPKSLRELGKVSLVPESYGADFLYHSPVFGLVGVQRKEVKDFIASVHDGRLGKELSQMKSLGLAMLLLEGSIQWGNDGSVMLNYGRWTMAQHHGMLWSMQLAGCWITTSSSTDQTSKLLSLFGAWIAKQRHSGLRTRPKPKDEFGRAGNRDWCLHMLQSFQGIGPGQAEAIYEHFGALPLEWTCSELDLQEVKGIGPKRAESLIRALKTTEVVLDAGM